MKQAMLLISFIFMVGKIYGDDNHMKISLKTDEKQIIIYDGVPRTVIMEALRKSRRMLLGSAEKAASIEGEYIIEVVEGNRHTIYSVQNNYWVSDDTNNILLRCSILSDLRGYLLSYLFNKREVKSLLEE
jgi:hypothetical protein